MWKRGIESSALCRYFDSKAGKRDAAISPVARQENKKGSRRRGRDLRKPIDRGRSPDDILLGPSSPDEP